jgi:nucleotide-binding universal stress UspA family protein
MYKDILLPIDLNHESSWEKALPTAIEYCKAFKSRLHVLTVMPDFGLPLVAGYFPEGFEEKASADVNNRLHAFVSEHVPDTIRVQHIIGKGTAYREILRVAGEVDADLIVMASHHPSFKDHLLGPNAERVVRHADISVLVVRN